MPSFIQQDPYRRYKAVKMVFQTALRAKCVVTRRDAKKDGETYVMVIAPTKDKARAPNGVKEAVLNLLELDHPNLVRVYEAYEHKGYCYYIMNDWTSNIVETSRFGITTLSEAQVAESIQELAMALLYMHQNGVVHGNLCFDDLHFTREFDDSKSVDSLNVLIVDLGIGRHVDEKRYVESHQDRRYGNPPETKEGKFTAKSDVWTLGSVAFRLLTGDVSSEHLLDRNQATFSVEKNLMSVSEEARDFCLKCLKTDAAERISMKDAAEHPWFSRVNHRSSCLLSTSVLNSLNKEQNRNEFMRRACTIVAKHLDDDQLKKYREVFDALDRDKSGYITHEDFVNALENNPNLPDNLTECFLDLDMDGNGRIAYREYLASTLRFKEDVQKINLIEAFHTMDVDDNGSLCANDLSSAMDITQDEARELICEALGHREDADPKISQEQFIDLFDGNHKYETNFQRFVIPVGETGWGKMQKS